jgi:hypothetical protein
MLFPQDEGIIAIIQHPVPEFIQQAFSDNNLLAFVCNGYDYIIDGELADLKSIDPVFPADIDHAVSHLIFAGTQVIGIGHDMLAFKGCFCFGVDQEVRCPGIEQPDLDLAAQLNFEIGHPIEGEDADGIIGGSGDIEGGFVVPATDIVFLFIERIATFGHYVIEQQGVRVIERLHLGIGQLVAFNQFQLAAAKGSKTVRVGFFLGAFQDSVFTGGQELIFETFGLQQDGLSRAGVTLLNGLMKEAVFLYQGLQVDHAICCVPLVLFVGEMAVELIYLALANTDGELVILIFMQGSETIGHHFPAIQDNGAILRVNPLVLSLGG